MLDFNSVPPQAFPVGGDLNQQRDALRADLLARLESVLMTLLPAGKKRGQKYLVGDVLGSPGDSLEVVLTGEKAGLWTDRADGNNGDIFDLVCSDYPPLVDVTEHYENAIRNLLGVTSAPASFDLSDTPF